MRLLHLVIVAVLTFCGSISTQAETVQPLKVSGENFVDPAGQNVRFWGVNLIALYPDHPTADALAKNLASLQVNLARLHHLLRPSTDWNPGMVSGCLALYQKDSRALDPDALDRFDYLNAALRRSGIYLALPLNASRLFRPGDVEILQNDDADKKAWMAAVDELNNRPWQQSIDVYKMLPVVDERAALLNEEFARNLLTHANPHSGLTYAKDPQVIMLEVMNEASTEYTIVCGNKFPDYWHKKLVAKWAAFAQAAGIPPGDLYSPADAQAVAVRAKFFRKLDEDYFDRVKAVVRSTGSQASVEFSNLWRGENALHMHAQKSDFMESHGYFDPSIVSKAEDGFYDLTKNRPAGKPFIVGELNQAEGDDNIRKQAPERTMLPLAASAYASLHQWNGIVWFAWLHGGQALGSDGWSSGESRSPELGRMMNDGMMIDHLRTAGMMFRQGLISPSKSPVTLVVDEPYAAGDYGNLIRGKYIYQPGWQNIHGVRKTFGVIPADQPAQPWMTQQPPNPLTSDTGELVKDIQRRQFSVASLKAEGFSGWLDDKTPAALKHLVISGQGFATVLLVPQDGKPLAETQRLLLSRTALDATHAENPNLKLSLRGLAAPSAGRQWQIHLTRPRAAAALMEVFTNEPWHKLTLNPDGSLQLPLGVWHECELSLR